MAEAPAIAPEELVNETMIRHGDRIRVGDRPAIVVPEGTPGAAKLTLGTGPSEAMALSVMIDHRNRKQRRAAAAKDRRNG